MPDPPAPAVLADSVLDPAPPLLVVPWVEAMLDVTADAAPPVDVVVAPSVPVGVPEVLVLSPEPAAVLPPAVLDVAFGVAPVVVSALVVVVPSPLEGPASPPRGLEEHARAPRHKHQLAVRTLPNILTQVSRANSPRSSSFLEQSTPRGWMKRSPGATARL
jgi:hypothetical protein